MTDKQTPTLEEFLAQRERDRIQPTVHALTSLARRISRGEVPATVGILNMVRAMHRDEKEYPPIPTQTFIEITEDDSMSSLLAGFRSDLDPEVRARLVQIAEGVLNDMHPHRAPGIYEVITASYNDRDGDVLMTEVEQHFRDLGASGSVLPFLKWVTGRKTMGPGSLYGIYTPAPVHEERRGVPDEHRFVFTQHNAQSFFGFQAKTRRSGREIVGHNLYVGFKKVA